MHIIDSIVRQEKERNLQMQAEYSQKIAELPQGCLSIRKLNNKEYCYLKYRKDGKVITQYAGTAESADEVREQIAKRKHFETILKNLKEEYKRIVEMESVK